MRESLNGRTVIGSSPIFPITIRREGDTEHFRLMSNTDGEVGSFDLRPLPGCNLYWVVTHLFVAERFRGRHIASNLLSELRLRARYDGKVLLLTTVTNEMRHILFHLGAFMMWSSPNPATGNTVSFWRL